MKTTSSLLLLAVMVPSLSQAASIADPAELKQYVAQAERACGALDFSSCEFSRSAVQAPTDGQVNFAVMTDAGETEYVAADCSGASETANIATAAAAKNGPGPWEWIKNLFRRRDDGDFHKSTERKSRRYFQGNKPKFQGGCNVGQT